MELTFDRSSDASAVDYVSVDTNGRTAAQIKFVRNPNHSIGMLWTTYELLNGAAGGVVFGNSVRLPFRNYLQLDGLAPGANLFTLRLEHLSGNVLSTARLLPGSGVYKGDLAPPRLLLESPQAHIEAEVGDVVRVPYSLVGVGYPARSVGVSLLGKNPAVAFTSPPSHFYPVVTGDRRNFFTLIGLSPGVYELFLDTTGQTAAARPAKLTLQINGR